MATKRKPASGKDEPESIYQVKITLLGTDPPIWRCIEVPTATSLGELHQVRLSGEP